MRIASLLLLTAAALWWLIGFVVQPEYAYLPPLDEVLNAQRLESDQAVDLWGERVSKTEAAELRKTDAGRDRLSPAQGAVAIDDAMLRAGRESFYRETFGNEIFLSAVLGIVSGPINPWSVSKAVLALHGRGTTNLQVRLDDAITVGGQSYAAGSLIDTGLDVVPGSLVPMGLKLKLYRGRPIVGITCAVCHATVDGVSMKVIEGAMNSDFEAGTVIAMGTNSAAYFAHAKSRPETYAGDPSRSVTTSDGTRAVLPEIRRFEDAVDADLMQWPAGSFDASPDLVGAPVKINNTFTFDDHPYGWSGDFPAGPFKGLAGITNHVHAIGSDALSQSGSSRMLMGIDTELYLATILQNAEFERFRYDPHSGRSPSEFFAAVDPTPDVPGVNRLVAMPSFPKASLMGEVGLAGGDASHHFMEQNNQLAAFQNTLAAPQPPRPVDAAKALAGRAVFEAAGCANCHAGSELTNHRIIPVAEIGTDPARAHWPSATAGHDVPPTVYAFDTPVPPPQDAKILPVPVDGLDPDQIRLGLARDGHGGYKVPSLIGLYWNAPYLHDSGVAVGHDAASDIGLPNSVLRRIAADPANSLLALIDQPLRDQVIAANQGSERLRDLHVTGAGHPFWIDLAHGYSPADQDAVIHYLLVGVLPTP